MKIIDGKGLVMGRLSSFVAKEALKGEEIAIVNCGQVIITGNLKTTEKEFFKKRNRFGHSQKGPKHPATAEKIVKRSIRGMLPNFRAGRGKEAFKKIKCYVNVPKEFEGKEILTMKQIKKFKFSEIKNFTKKK